MAEKRKKVRVAATVQMVAGEDDDLIVWYRQLPKGAGNREIKEVLRRGLGLPVLEPEAVVEERVIDQKLEWLNDQIQSIQDFLNQSGPPSSGGIAVDHEAINELRSMFTKHTRHMASEMRRLESQVAAINTGEDVAPATEQLDSAKIERRQRRLAKQKW
jgi:hypothetical protein